MQIPSRTLSIPKQIPMEIDRYALESFQSDVLTSVNKHDTQIEELRNITGTLRAQFVGLKDMIDWIGTHRPEAIEDYNTTKQVTQRLENSNDGEVMTEAYPT